MFGALGSLVGGLLGKDAARDAAGINRDMQRQFAQYGIRWKVDDAKAAGIHPLAALGASTHSFSPVFQGDNSLGEGLARAGQDISRSIEATRTQRERDLARSAQDAAMQVQARESAARVSMYEAQANLANAQAHKLTFVGPPMPSADVNPSTPDQVVRRDTPEVAPPGLWKVKPAEVQSGRPGQPGILAGPPNPAERTISFRGRTYQVPNVDLDSFIEDPVTSIAIIAALNPGMTDDLVEELWTRGLGLPSLRNVGMHHRYWGFRGPGPLAEHINRVRKGWKSQAPIGH